MISDLRHHRKLIILEKSLFRIGQILILGIHMEVTLMPRNVGVMRTSQNSVTTKPYNSADYLEVRRTSGRICTYVRYFYVISAIT